MHEDKSRTGYKRSKTILVNILEQKEHNKWINNRKKELQEVEEGFQSGHTARVKKRTESEKPGLDGIYGFWFKDSCSSTTASKNQLYLIR